MCSSDLQLQQELRETHEEMGTVQRLLDEEREKSVRYAGQLHELRLRWESSEAALFKVIRILAKGERP